MRCRSMWLFLTSAVFVHAQSVLVPATERPLTALPYTPGLDVSAMDRTIDPCVNFYRYSCNTWIKNNPIPPDQARWDVYAKLQQDNQRFLWGLLEQAAKPG